MHHELHGTYQPSPSLFTAELLYNPLSVPVHKILTDEYDFFTPKCTFSKRAFCSCSLPKLTAVSIKNRILID